MAALFRGLRAGRALRGLGMVVAKPAATRPQYNNLRRGFHRTVLRLQDESKSNTTSSSSDPSITTSSSSSTSFHQHYQAQPAGEDTTTASSEAAAHPAGEDTATASSEAAAHPAGEDTATASSEAAAHPAGEDTTTASHEAAASDSDTTETETASQSNTSYQDQGGEEDEEYETEEQLQARILAAALEFVPVHGWTMEAIAAGAETLGLSSASTGMYNNGAGDLVLHFIAHCNSQLTNILAEQHNQVQLGKAEPKETAQFLRDAVETRLRMVIPYIDTWPQAMSILLLPHNIPDSLKHLSTLMDDIWFYAGDRSTDLNWYTKRAALTGIYNTTELVMLQDSSPDFENTWKFLDNRIQDVVNMAGTAKQVQATGEAVAQGLMGAAVTLKNLTGLNQKR